VTILKNITGVLGAVAPSIAQTISGPLGSVAMTALSKVLSTDQKPVKPTEESIAQALQHPTPEQLLAVKQAEQDFRLQMEKLEVDVFKIEAEDKQDARRAFSKDWTTRIIGVFTLFGFFGYIFLVTIQPPEQNSEALTNLVLGYLGGLSSAIISFYFGASHGGDK
tara:strand:- start:161 stop:655 length:495 start_codon:yes stop_codon:yes gene_type:complete